MALSMRTVLTLFAAAANAQSPIDTPSIVAKISPAVVLIKGESQTGTVLGSGLIVSRDGKIATNLHVIRSLKTAGVQLSTGEIFDTISILSFDDRKDLAIIKIAGFDLPAVELGNSNEVRSGERVTVIGSPRGLQGTVTTGVVSALRDEPTGAGFKVIQTDASVNPGNSGGPLLNDRGQAIGIVTFKLRESEGLNFAVPINYVRAMLDNLGGPMSLEQLQASLAVTSPGAFKSTSYAALWKSLSTGKVRSVRVEGEFIYAETVRSEAERKNQFDSYELKKDGEAFRGVSRSGGMCSYPSLWDGSAQYNNCSFEHKIEFTSVTQSRIEGRLFAPPNSSKFNCKKCSYSSPSAWIPFVWISQ